MKRFILFARLSTLFIFAIPLTGAAQLLDQFPNYVVIGAFAHHKNAASFTRDAGKHQFAAQFEMNPNRNLYYVYVLATDDREQAISEAVKLRAETKYFDTWVYFGALGDMTLANPEGTQPQDLNPLTGERIADVRSDRNSDNPAIARGGDGPAEDTRSTSSDDRFVSDQNTNLQSQARKTSNGEGVQPTGNNSGSSLNRPLQISEDQQTDGEAEGNNIDAVNEMGSPPVRASVEPLKAEDVPGKDLYFYLFRGDNRRMIAGEVEAIDFEKSRKMATYPANKPVAVRLPSGTSQQISLLCQVFGYRKVQREFDPEKPAEDFYMDENGSLVVPFELTRLQKGDMAIMYNVFFFKDAAIMRPESRYEVNNLLEMLQENPSYKIKIHGHTNGNASGKIVRMGSTTNFYSLTDTKQGAGSARQLSEERAAVIREFLISSGIDPNRMEVKAWGGKKPIHDKHSTRANENVRVEVEILSE